MVMFNNKSLPQIAKRNVVTSAFYTKGELWYKINVEDKILEFPVPISDTGDGTFLSSDKATLFLRYIRKHLEHIEEGKNTNEKDR